LNTILKPTNSPTNIGRGNLEQQAGISLVPKYLIGLKPDVNPGVLAINDSVIAYVCGHNVVLYDIETKIQRYILGKSLNLRANILKVSRAVNV